MHVGERNSRTRPLPLSTSGGHFFLMVEPMLKPRETSGRSLRCRIERRQTSRVDRASAWVEANVSGQLHLLHMLHTTRPFALSLRSWRLLFATSFGPAPLTVIDPRYSAHERVGGALGASSVALGDVGPGLGSTSRRPKCGSSCRALMFVYRERDRFRSSALEGTSYSCRRPS